MTLGVLEVISVIGVKIYEYSAKTKTVEATVHNDEY